MNKYTFTGQGHKFKVKYKVKVLASEGQTMPLLDWIGKHHHPAFMGSVTESRLWVFILFLGLRGVDLVSSGWQENGGFVQ